MVRLVAGRVGDHADANVANLDGAPVGDAGAARVNRYGHGRPVGEAKWDAFDLHLEPFDDVQKLS